MASLPYRLPIAAITEAPEYMEHLKQKRRAAEDIAMGLLKWLTLDIDADIKRLQEPPPAIPMLYKPSPEELIKATEEVQLVEEQLNRMLEARDQMPDEMKAMAGFALPMFETRLRDAREYRDRLQQQLEQTEQPLSGAHEG